MLLPVGTKVVAERFQQAYEGHTETPPRAGTRNHPVAPTAFPELASAALQRGSPLAPALRRDGAGIFQSLYSGHGESAPRARREGTGHPASDGLLSSMAQEWSAHKAQCPQLSRKLEAKEGRRGLHG